jgi:hypothetical protein
VEEDTAPANHPCPCCGLIGPRPLPSVWELIHWGLIEWTPGSKRETDMTPEKIEPLLVPSLFNTGVRE